MRTLRKVNEKCPLCGAAVYLRMPDPGEPGPGYWQCIADPLHCGYRWTC